jgi:excisionase family DNA binding protein
MKVAETAEALRLSTAKIYELVAAKRMPCVRIDGCIRFSPERVRQFIESRTQPTAAQPVAGS